MEPTYFFYDTETTGLPKEYAVTAENYKQWPRIIQLAWIVCNHEGELLDSFCHLIKPEGWVVPSEPFWADKGYTTAKNEAFGVPIQAALEKFIIARKSHPFTVGYNLGFDRLMVRSELYRMGRNPNFKARKICTMVASTDYVRLPGRSGKSFKWPKLEELYKFLFDEELIGAHDALIDIKATAKCFFEMKKRGWFNGNMDIIPFKEWINQ